MKQFEKILIITFILLCSVITCFGCTSQKNSVTYSVNGTVKGVDDFSDIVILINDTPVNTKVNNDGTFSLAGLKTDDVISFSKEGYIFNTYKVGKINAIDVEVVGVFKTFDLVINYDGDLGVVTYEKSCKFGDEILITFTSNEHAKFQGLYDGETLLTTETSYMYKVVSERALTARFEKILYDISFSKNYQNANATISANAMSFGDEVTLTAESDDNYEFVKWIVNGEEIIDKTYNYAIDCTTPTILAVFKERLEKPVLTANGTVVSWCAVDNADGYEVYIDDVKIDGLMSRSIDIKDYNLYSGNINIKIVAYSSNYSSSSSSLCIEYLRPYDTPKNVGIEISSGDVFLVFSRVLAADSYNIYVDNILYDISTFNYSANGNIVKVNVSNILLESKQYAFCVTAKGTLPESNKSSVVTYTYLGVLAESVVSFSENILTWSHEKEDVTFDISINGVLVQQNVSAGNLNVSDYLDEGETAKSATVVARLNGYKNSIVNKNL